MGFEAALALVVPEDGDLYDHQKDPDKEDDGDLFFDDYIKIPVPARLWRAFKFIDFGRVRTLVKSSSSLTTAERAAGKFDHRAAKCAASFLLAKFFTCEARVEKGDYEYAVPFIVDHYLYARRYCDKHLEQYSFAEALLCSFGRQFVTGLFALDDLRTNPTHGAIFQGALWEHNRRLIKETVTRATNLDGHFGQSSCGLVWTSASEVRAWLEELILGDSPESIELRKDPLALALTRSWCYEMELFGELGVKVIMLTDYFYHNAFRAIRSRSMCL